jgi:fructose-bisphosphate aldolase, class II
MHGMLPSMVYGKARKRLNIERIAQVKKATGVFLTLHGGSGTDDEDFRNAIAAGINFEGFVDSGRRGASDYRQ